MSAKITKSTSARGSNRGGVGGGYERTNPEYNADRLRQLRRDYDEMEESWRPVFLDSLTKWERAYITDRRMETPKSD